MKSRRSVIRNKLTQGQSNYALMGSESCNESGIKQYEHDVGELSELKKAHPQHGMDHTKTQQPACSLNFVQWHSNFVR